MTRFNEFWDALPAKRRTNKKGCLEKWETKKLDAEADRIVKWVRAMSKTDEWKRGYNPAPMTILNQERWNDGMPEWNRPEVKEETKTLSPSQVLDWVIKNKELSAKQLTMQWKWLTKEGVLAGVIIPPDNPAPGHTIMFSEVYDLSEKVPGV